MGTKDKCNTPPAKCLLPASVLKVLCKAPKNKFIHSSKNVEYIQDTASTARVSNKLHPQSAFPFYTSPFLFRMGFRKKSEPVTL